MRSIRIVLIQNLTTSALQYQDVRLTTKPGILKRVHHQYFIKVPGEWKAVYRRTVPWHEWFPLHHPNGNLVTQQPSLGTGLIAFPNVRVTRPEFYTIRQSPIAIPVARPSRIDDLKKADIDCDDNFKWFVRVPEGGCYPMIWDGKPCCRASSFEDKGQWRFDKRELINGRFCLLASTIQSRSGGPPMPCYNLVVRAGVRRASMSVPSAPGAQRENVRHASVPL